MLPIFEICLISVLSFICQQKQQTKTHFDWSFSLLILIADSNNDTLQLMNDQEFGINYHYSCFQTTTIIIMNMLLKNLITALSRFIEHQSAAEIALWRMSPHYWYDLLYQTPWQSSIALVSGSSGDRALLFWKVSLCTDTEEAEQRQSSWARWGESGLVGKLARNMEET